MKMKKKKVLIAISLVIALTIGVLAILLREDRNYIVSSEKEMIFTEKPTESCHASTVLPLDNGTVVTAWFGGTNEKNDDVNIYTSVRNCDGQWSTPVMVTADLSTAHWNPVLFVREDGNVILYFKVGKEIWQWKTYYSISTDGKSWSEPEELVPGDEGNGRGPVKNKPITLANGTVLAGASDENGDIWRTEKLSLNNGGKIYEFTNQRKS